MSNLSDEELQSLTSNSESEASFGSSDLSLEDCGGDFLPYDENLEPIANEQEAAEYAVQVAEEEEEEQMLLSRYSGEVDITDWCKCSNCSLELIVKPEECRCCIDVDRCRERMEEADQDNQCITSHPGFADVCLNRWVLQIAGIGLKTKAKKSYSTMRTQRNTAEPE